MILCEKILLLIFLLPGGVTCFVSSKATECTSLVCRESFPFVAYTRRRLSCASRLRSSSNSGFPWEAPVPSEDGKEETLLRIHLSINRDVDKNEALTKVERYTQSFPFAAVLPVQPLQYLPTQDGGVDVIFLRKKTKEKGTVDGGLRFFVRGDETGEGIDVFVKRNSEGQSVSKMFSEKLVVQAFVQGISGESNDRTGVAPTDLVSIKSVFHKWM